jgi:hypothetical protein
MVLKAPVEPKVNVWVVKVKVAEACEFQIETYFQFLIRAVP